MVRGLFYWYASGMISLGLALLLSIHPGGRDANGCHVCRTDCEAKGYKTGERHCHGEPKLGSKPGTAPKSEPKPEAPPKLRHGQKAYVEKVIDGDTLKVRVGEHRYSLRIQGIDCPESKPNAKCKRDVDNACEAQIPKGRDASKFAAKLVKQKTVTLEATSGEGELDHGRYGRPLAYVRLDDGRDFGLEMVKHGCADYGWKYPHPRSAQYVAAMPK